MAPYIPLRLSMLHRFVTKPVELNQVTGAYLGGLFFKIRLGTLVCVIFNMNVFKGDRFFKSK